MAFLQASGWEGRGYTGDVPVHGSAYSAICRAHTSPATPSPCRAVLLDPSSIPDEWRHVACLAPSYDNASGRRVCFSCVNLMRWKTHTWPTTWPRRAPRRSDFCCKSAFGNAFAAGLDSCPRNQLCPTISCAVRGPGAVRARLPYVSTWGRRAPFHHDLNLEQPERHSVRGLQAKDAQNKVASMPGWQLARFKRTNTGLGPSEIPVL